MATATTEFKVPKDLKPFLKGAVLARKQGQDPKGVLAALALMPNTAKVGSNGIHPAYGEDFVGKAFAAYAAEAEKALEAEKKARERKALEAKQSALRAAVEGVDISEGLDPKVILPRVDSATALKAHLILIAEEGVLNLSVGGLKAPKVGRSGGKPANDQPREWVTVDSGERVVGLVTDWARANVPEAQLKLAKHDKAGKLRGGKVLVTFLTKEQKPEGAEAFGPFLKESKGEAFEAAVAAWKASKDAPKASDDSTEVSEDSEKPKAD
jgi:hypothetical protein